MLLLLLFLISPKKLAFFGQNTAILQNWIGLQENSPTFFRKTLPKIAKNRYHNIDPSMCGMCLAPKLTRNWQRHSIHSQLFGRSGVI
jgi:hypothetical protein